jgi:hypothetical protein
MMPGGTRSDRVCVDMGFAHLVLCLFCVCIRSFDNLIYMIRYLVSTRERGTSEHLRVSEYCTTPEHRVDPFHSKSFDFLSPVDSRLLNNNVTVRPTRFGRRGRDQTRRKFSKVPCSSTIRWSNILSHYSFIPRSFIRLSSCQIQWSSIPTMESQSSTKLYILVNCKNLPAPILSVRFIVLIHPHHDRMIDTS